MITQNEAIMTDYITKIYSLLAKIQVECSKNSSTIKSDDNLGWDEILICLDKNPLPTLKEHFKTDYDSLLEDHSQKSLIEIDSAIIALNQTNDFIFWKQGVNYLLSQLQNNSYKPFYHGPEYAPENFIL